MWGSGAFNSVLVSNSREPAQKGLSKNKSLPAEVQFHQKTRLQQGPVLKAMLSPLPPPTQQQMNCLCSGLLVVTYRRSHGKGVTVTLCWINISSWTLVWLFDPLLWKQRTPPRSWWQGAKLYPWGAPNPGMHQWCHCRPGPTGTSVLACMACPWPSYPRGQSTQGLEDFVLPLRQWEVSACKNSTCIWQAEKQPDIFWPVLLNGGLPSSWSQLSQ